MAGWDTDWDTSLRSQNGYESAYRRAVQLKAAVTERLNATSDTWSGIPISTTRYIPSDSIVHRVLALMPTTSMGAREYIMACKMAVKWMLDNCWWIDTDLYSDSTKMTPYFIANTSATDFPQLTAATAVSNVSGCPSDYLTDVSKTPYRNVGYHSGVQAYGGGYLKDILNQMMYLRAAYTGDIDRGTYPWAQVAVNNKGSWATAKSDAETDWDDESYTFGYYHDGPYCFSYGNDGYDAGLARGGIGIDISDSNERPAVANQTDAYIKPQLPVYPWGGGSETKTFDDNGYTSLDTSRYGWLMGVNVSASQRYVQFDLGTDKPEWCDEPTDSDGETKGWQNPDFSDYDDVLFAHDFKANGDFTYY